MNEKRVEAPLRVLLLTNQLYDWSGSETVILEIAEVFVGRGARVTLFANDAVASFCKEFAPMGLHHEKDAEQIDLLSFDLVYCQHQVLTLFATQLLQNDTRPRPTIIYGHLSPYEPLEFPGPVIEMEFADHIMCNSPETLGRMRELGLPEAKLQIFPNPAPKAFFDVPASPTASKRILAVSNHFPPELLKAFAIIEQSDVRVTRRGREFENKRVTPADMENHDAVISIGKTVQYAIAAQRPVFVYDRFGGPGWLDQDNLEKAAEFNFSGRCSNNKLRPSAIASAVLTGLLGAKDKLDGVSQYRDRYRLDHYVDQMISWSKSRAAQTEAAHSTDPARIGAIEREFHMYRNAVTLRAMAHNKSNLDQSTLQHLSTNRLAWLALWLAAKLSGKETRQSVRTLYQAVRDERRKR